MTLARNEQALIELVTGDARTRCDEALARARDESVHLLREARAEARRNVKRAFDDARRQGRERVAAANAMLDTRRRLAQQRRSAALLAACWQALPAALIARWQADATRAQWVASTLDAALRALPRRRWRIAHAPGLTAAERDALVARVAQATGEAPDVEAAVELTAGLRVVADGTSIDATLAGLLADRHEIGAALLQRLDEETEK